MLRAHPAENVRGWETRPRDSSFRQFLLEALGFVVGNQAVDERTEFSVDDVGELVERQADAVIGHAILREVIGADFLGTVAGLDLTATLRGDGRLLLFLLEFVEAGAAGGRW